MFRQLLVDAVEIVSSFVSFTNIGILPTLIILPVSIWAIFKFGPQQILKDKTLKRNERVKKIKWFVDYYRLLTYTSPVLLLIATSDSSFYRGAYPLLFIFYYIPAAYYSLDGLGKYLEKRKQAKR